VKPKISNVLNMVKSAIQSGNYHFTGHAEERLQQRQVTRMESIMSGTIQLVERRLMRGC